MEKMTQEDIFIENRKFFVSENFIEAVRKRKEKFGEPLYKFAIRVNINPTTLSRIINRTEAVKINDPKILHIGESLGLAPEDCFKCEQPCSAKG